MSGDVIGLCEEVSNKMACSSSTVVEHIPHNLKVKSWRAVAAANGTGNIKCQNNVQIRPIFNQVSFILDYASVAHFQVPNELKTLQEKQTGSQLTVNYLITHTHGKHTGTQAHSHTDTQTHRHTVTQQTHTHIIMDVNIYIKLPQRAKKCN